MSKAASRALPRGQGVWGKSRIAGVGLISLVGLIHLLVTPEYYGFAAYLGLLIFANFAGSAVSAVGIYQGRLWGWVLGVVMAAGAFVAYVESRTLGLPGLPSWEPFTEPPGMISLLVEGIFLGVAGYVLLSMRRSKGNTAPFRGPI